MELYFCYYSYSRYSGGSFLDGLLLLLTVTLSELHKKPRTKDWVTGKNKLKNLCGGYHFFHCTPSFLRHFLSLSLSSPFPFPMVGILCDNTMSKRSEIVTLFQFSTSLLASLVRWYYFRLCFSLSCFASDLTLIKKTHIDICFYRSCYESSVYFITLLMILVWFILVNQQRNLISISILSWGI